MRIIACGDLHLVESNPKRRTDNYFETLMDKMKFTSDYAYQHGITTIIYPGDIFDTHKASNRLIASTIDFFSSNYYFSGEYIFAVIGNHDQVYRSEDNSPMQILSASGIIDLLDKEPIMTTNSNRVEFYGCNFGSEIPAPSKSRPTKCLVIHKMISDKDYWNGHVKYSGAIDFLKEHPEYDIVISGDNHHSFTAEYEGRILLNAGSLGRSKIDQINHKPCFFDIETDDLSYEQVFIPILPAKQVFDLGAVEKEKEENKALEEFVSSLPSVSNHQPMNYVSNVIDFVSRDPNIEKDVSSIIYECLEGLETT